ncbi:MAG: glycosyltransferase [Conexibacter sp.]
MRILHLTPHLPYAPGGHGGATRQFHLLRRLVERGHEVTVVVPVTAEQRELVALPRAEGIRVEAINRPRSRVAETLALLGREPSLVPRAAVWPLHAWQLAVLWQELRPAVRRLLAERSPDLVSAEHDVAASWIADLPRELPTLLTLENVTSDYYAARAAAAQGAATRWFALETRRADRYARAWLPRWRTLVCVSDEDAASLRRRYGVDARTIANGVDLDAFPPVADEPTGPPTLLFTGTMNYAPNVEGICWFVAEAWPAVRARRPEARLRIVGRDPTEAVRRLANAPGVEVTGAVPDVAPHFRDAHLVVVPLRSGGGTRLKILEAASAGRAIVSTPRGAEGLAVEDDRELVLAQTAPQFAAAVVELLDDPVRRTRLGRAARALAERHDWHALGDELEQVALETAAAQPRTSSP